jgi:hypothetical protein
MQRPIASTEVMQRFLDPLAVMGYFLELRRQHNDARPRIDRQSVGHDRAQFVDPASPWAATMPSSARCARKALMIWVR